MSYTPPSYNGADINFDVGYVPPGYSAVDLTFTQPHVFSISGYSTLSFSSSTIGRSVFSLAGSSLFSPQTSERSVAIGGSAVASFVYPDRSVGFVGQTVATPVVKMIGAATGVVPGSASLSIAGETLASAAMSVLGSTAFSAINLSIGKAFFRANNKAQVIPIPRFNKDVTFHSNGCTTVVAHTKYYADIRIRGRSRTIMRIRSGPWPW